MPTVLARSPLAQERFQRKLEAALATVTAGDIMTKRPSWWPSALAVRELARDVLPAVSFSSFPTYDARGALDGLVVLNRALDLQPLAGAGLRLADIAISREHLACVYPDSTLIDILPTSQMRCAGRVLVVGHRYQPGHPQPLLGIITPSDVAFHLRGMGAGYA